MKAILLASLLLVTFANQAFACIDVLEARENEKINISCERNCNIDKELIKSNVRSVLKITDIEIKEGLPHGLCKPDNKGHSGVKSAKEGIIPPPPPPSVSDLQYNCPFTQVIVKFERTADFNISDKLSWDRAQENQEKLAWMLTKLNNDVFEFINQKYGYKRSAGPAPTLGGCN